MLDLLLLANRAALKRDKIDQQKNYRLFGQKNATLWEFIFCSFFVNVYISYFSQKYPFRSVLVNPDSNNWDSTVISKAFLFWNGHVYCPWYYELLIFYAKHIIRKISIKYLQFLILNSLFSALMLLRVPGNWLLTPMCTGTF